MLAPPGLRRYGDALEERVVLRPRFKRSGRKQKASDTACRIVHRLGECNKALYLLSMVIATSITML